MLIHLIAAAGFVTFVWLAMYALCRHGAPPKVAPHAQREAERQADNEARCESWRPM